MVTDLVNILLIRIQSWFYPFITCYVRDITVERNRLETPPAIWHGYAMLCISPEAYLLLNSVCPFVCLSVTTRYCVQTA